MSLIKCSECGKEISSLAAACLSCGAPVSSNNVADSSKGATSSAWTAEIPCPACLGRGKHFSWLRFFLYLFLWVPLLLAWGSTGTTLATLGSIFFIFAAIRTWWPECAACKGTSRVKTEISHN